jgi:hypothetical protein
MDAWKHCRDHFADLSAHLGYEQCGRLISVLDRLLENTHKYDCLEPDISHDFLLLRKKPKAPFIAIWAGHASFFAKRLPSKLGLYEYDSEFTNIDALFEWILPELAQRH